MSSSVDAALIISFFLLLIKIIKWQYLQIWLCNLSLRMLSRLKSRQDGLSCWLDSFTLSVSGLHPSKGFRKTTSVSCLRVCVDMEGKQGSEVTAGLFSTGCCFTFYCNSSSFWQMLNNLNLFLNINTISTFSLHFFLFLFVDCVQYVLIFQYKLESVRGSWLWHSQD